MSDASGQAPAGRSFLATVLIVLGLVWMTLSGLCTGAVIVFSLAQGDVRALFNSMPVLALIAIICIGPGWLIWQAGRWLARRRNCAGG